MPVWAAGSVLAHIALVAAFLAPWDALRRAPPPPPDTQAAVEVVMVQQPAQAPGQQQAAAAPPPPDPGEAPPQPEAPPAVNLGGTASDPWSVRSDTLRPAGPDARYRNLPPRYPPEAAQHHETGTVGIIVHVTPGGTADGTTIANSSGVPSLDEEARRALLLWHFTPARLNGRAVPSDYAIDIHFSGAER